MSFGKRVAEADPIKVKFYWLPGRYVVEIIDTKIVTNRNALDVVIIESKILESDNEERKVGQICSMARMKHWDSTPGEIKTFIANIVGVDHEEITAEDVDLIFSGENPLAGKIANLEVIRIDRSDKNKGPFDRCIWSHYDNKPLKNDWDDVSF